MPDDLESLLGRMPLRRPSASLDARVLSGRRSERPGVGWMLAAGAAGAAVAAGVAVTVLALAGAFDRSTASADPLEAPQVAAGEVHRPPPVHIERQWTHLCYEGVVAPEGEPMAKFRRQVVRQLEWVDPDDGARMEMTVPREDVILIEATVY